MLTFPSAHDILLAHSLLACKYLNTKILYLFQALGQKRQLGPGMLDEGMPFARSEDSGTISVSLRRRSRHSRCGSTRGRPTRKMSRDLRHPLGDARRRPEMHRRLASRGSDPTTPNDAHYRSTRVLCVHVSPAVGIRRVTPLTRVPLRIVRTPTIGLICPRLAACL